MKKFLHLSVNPIDQTGRKLIEKKLDKAADWLRYLPNCWLIYTAQPARVWYERLSEVTEEIEGCNLFIAEVNLRNRAGWIKTSAWDWINKKRPE